MMIYLPPQRHGERYTPFDPARCHAVSRKSVLNAAVARQGVVKIRQCHRARLDGADFCGHHLALSVLPESVTVFIHPDAPGAQPL